MGRRKAITFISNDNSEEDEDVNAGNDTFFF